MPFILRVIHTSNKYCDTQKEPIWPQIRKASKREFQFPWDQTHNNSFGKNSAKIEDAVLQEDSPESGEHLPIFTFPLQYHIKRLKLSISRTLGGLERRYSKKKFSSYHLRGNNHHPSKYITSTNQTQSVLVIKLHYGWMQQRCKLNWTS